MKNIGIKLVIIYLVLGCSPKPDGLISEKEMSELIADLKTLEAKLDNHYFKKMDSSRVAYAYLQEKIFKKYHTDSSAYRRSYDFYLQDKSKMIEIYEKAATILDDTTVIQSELPIIELDDKKPGNRPHLQRNRKH